MLSLVVKFGLIRYLFRVASDIVTPSFYWSDTRKYMQIYDHDLNAVAIPSATVRFYVGFCLWFVMAIRFYLIFAGRWAHGVW